MNMEKGTEISLKPHEFAIYYWLKESNGRISAGFPRMVGSRIIETIMKLKELGLINYTDIKVNKLHQEYNWYIYEIVLDNFSIKPVKIRKVTTQRVDLLLEDSERQPNQQS